MRRALLAIVLIVAACGPDLTSTPGADSPVDGIVIAVDATSITTVKEFTLKTSSGATLVFKLGQLENASQFSPSHLSEHLATSAPIRVWFQFVNGDRIVYRLEDASAAPAAT